MMVKKLMPVIVLTVICLVATATLVGTYGLTKPVIEKNNALRADRARVEVLEISGNQGFESYSYDEIKKMAKGKLPEGTVEVYVARNNLGMVITTEDRGFGGSLLVMTGIDKRGRIRGVKVLDHNETPGLGTKAMTKEFFSQYLFKDKIDNSVEASDDIRVDGITGATVTSEAVYRAVVKALTVYELIGGIQD